MLSQPISSVRPLSTLILYKAIFFIKKPFNFPKSHRVILLLKGTMEIKIAIIQFLFANNWKVLSDSLGANPALETHKFMTAPDLLKFCSTEQNCLVLVNVSSKDDLIQLATFVKNSRKVLKNTVLKIVVLNSTENKQFEKAITKLGNVEILEPSVNVKALRFKMDFWMKAMRGQAKKLGTLNQKTVEASGSETAAETKTLVHAPPLECENDIWILQRESDCKRIIGRWMVKLMGPGPYVGQWNEVPKKPNVYAFQIKKSFADEFISGEGNWLFKGEQKPEFHWQENRWMFTGDSFELFFYDGEKILSRVKLADKVLTIAGNSVFAKTKESLILDSFNKELVFKSEAEHLRDQSLEFENEGDLGGHMSGKVKDKEESGKGHLEGKVKDQEESKGNLEGKIKDREEAKGNLQGKIKDREDSKNNLHGKVKDQEESKGNLEGKIKDKEEGKNDLSGKIKPGEKAPESKSEKNHSQSNEQIAGNLKGKVSTDSKSAEDGNDEHKQHNEKLANTWGGDVKEYAADEKTPNKKHENVTDNISSPELRGGKETTDKLNNLWGGKSGSEAVNNKGQAAPGTGEHRDGSLLDLKKTEKEHQTHYKNHNEAQKYEADETKKNQYQEDSEGGAIGGSSSTDKIASHYGSGKPGTPGAPGSSNRIQTHTVSRRNIEKKDPDSLEEENKKSPFAGKGHTDKLKGHYGSANRTQSNKAGSEENFDDVIEELEASIERVEFAESDNVLPFRASEEKDLEKLTESAKLSSYIIQNSVKYDCKLDDYFDNTVIFISKNEGLKNTEKAVLDITLEYQSERAKIDCEGQIISIDDDGTGGFFVTVEVSQNDARSFDHFMTLLKSRQENIASFIMKAKGF